MGPRSRPPPPGLHAQGSQMLIPETTQNPASGEQGMEGTGSGGQKRRVNHGHGPLMSRVLLGCPGEEGSRPRSPHPLVSRLSSLTCPLIRPAAAPAPSSSTC